MRRIVPVALLFVLTAVAVMPAPARAGGDDPAAKALVLLNERRISLGLPPLAISSALSLSAQAHAIDMARRGYFSHFSPEGHAPWDRAARHGYASPLVGENIAVGTEDAADVMAAWVRSPGHDENMCDPIWREVGIGVAIAANGRVYWVQDFGVPTNPDP